MESTLFDLHSTFNIQKYTIDIKHFLARCLSFYFFSFQFVEIKRICCSAAPPAASVRCISWAPVRHRLHDAVKSARVYIYVCVFLRCVRCVSCRSRSSSSLPSSSSSGLRVPLPAVSIFLYFSSLQLHLSHHHPPRRKRRQTHRTVGSDPTWCCWSDHYTHTHSEWVDVYTSLS